MTRVIRLDQLDQFAAVKIVSDPGEIGGPVVIPQAVQVTYVWALSGGKTGHCVLYGRYPGTFSMTSATATAALQALTTGAAWTALAAHIAPTVQLGSLFLRDVNEPDRPIIQATAGTAPGTSTGTALPDEVAVCITFQTGFAGPSGRGRIYIPGWATTALGTGNVVAAAAVTALGNWATTNIGNSFAAMSATHVLGLQARASYTGTTGTVHPARAAMTRDVTARVVKDNHWDSQRRRGLR